MMESVKLSILFLFVSACAPAPYFASVNEAASNTTAAAASIAVPHIQYSSSSYTFSDSTASTTSVPTNTGGAISGCTISPALPAGLGISTTDCTVSGTPGGTSVLTTYTITPSNAGGNGDSVNIDIVVQTLSYSISGALTIGGFVGDPTAVQVILHLRDAGTNNLILNQTVNLSAGAVYTLSGVSNGTYNLYINSACRFMRKKLAGLVVNSANLTNLDATLKNGDANASNSVNILDWSALSVANGTHPGDAGWNACADFDGNGVVEAGAGMGDKVAQTTYWFQTGDAEP